MQFKFEDVANFVGSYQYGWKNPAIIYGASSLSCSLPALALVPASLAVSLLSLAPAFAFSCSLKTRSRLAKNPFVIFALKYDMNTVYRARRPMVVAMKSTENHSTMACNHDVSAME